MTVQPPAVRTPRGDHRRRRLAPPAVATDDLVLAPPPETAPPAPPPLRAQVLPLVMVAATVGMTVLFVTSGAASARTPMMLVLPLMMLVSLAGMLAGGGPAGRPDLDGERRDYGRHLADIAGRAAAVAAQQTAALRWVHPDPGTLWTFAGHRRMAERGPGDSDFLEVRVGTGPQRLAAALVAPATGPADDVDPVGAMWLRDLVAAHASVDDAPVAVALRGLATLAVDGVAARDLVRAVLCQVVTLHDPADVAVVAVLTDATRASWDWLKWLPHHVRDDVSDACGAGRLTVAGVAAAAAALDGLAGRTHVVVLIDDGLIDDGPGDSDRGGHRHGDREPLPARPGTMVVRIGAARDGDARPAMQLVAGAGCLAVRRADRPDEVFAVGDALSVEDATRCARRLARVASGAASPAVDAAEAAPTSWPELMGLVDIDTLGDGSARGDGAGSDRDGTQRLRVPIGVRDDGTPLHLDLKEAAEGGVGPHGLCVGATGSGKSELLRTLVLGLVAGHAPTVVNLVLIDFKGGATFLGLERAPHVAAIITNLADEAHLLARMKDALAGELTRRQEVLRAAGVGSVAEYDRARAAGAPLAPLPALVVVVDEFSELLHQQPDVAELFVAIGRLGRSLRVHLLLASQRLDEGRLRGLETHLSYRLCLKTFSAHESRAVIGVPDAHTLSGGPGAAYLRTVEGELVAFRAAYVSGGHVRPPTPPVRSATATAPTSAAPPRAVARFAATPVGATTARNVAVAPAPASGRPDAAPAGRSLLDTVLDRVASSGPRAHAVWLPPRCAPPTLDALPIGGDLRVSVGLVDRPFEQRRDPLTLDLSGAAGNVAVVGAPQSGKSTALRTLVAALARGHGPDEVQCYCLDFGGGSLATVAPLPHVGSVAGRGDADLARRIVAVLTALVHHRERLFRRLRIDSAAEYRRRRAAGTVGDDDGWVDRHGEVFLLVDGWATMRRDHEALEASITELAATGLSFGVHVVVTASRWGELRAALTDQLGTRLELRLGEASDSVLDRRAAARVPAAPGSGITATGHQLRLALPRDDGRDDTAGLPEALAAFGERLRARWPGRVAEPVRLLPDTTPAADLPLGTRPTAVALGLDDDELATAWLDFATQPHLLVLGDNGCGKTATLRRICRALVAGHDASAVSLWIVDLRRTLLGVVDGPHLGGYLMSPSACEAAFPELLATLRGRLPGPDVTQAQLRERSWWTGPEVYVVVDDHDLVAGAAVDPLAPLVGLLPHAVDIGLHLVVARRSGGAARAMYDPLLARMRELGGAGLLMSCGPDEGALFAGVRPAALPPGRATLVRRAGDTSVVQVGWDAAP